MKNPLNKRFLRELRGEFGKYLVIFILMTATIGFVSGFLVADNSMIKAYNESFEKYHVENGNFRTAEELTGEQKAAIEAEDVTLYENFYVEEEVDNGSTLRIYQNREEVDLVCLMKGELPVSDSEIAIDRMYADNNGFSVGDTIEAGGRRLTITGLVALPDYSCLFSDNSDTMFDAVKFGVAIMTPEGFASFGDIHLSYNYSWLYKNAPGDDIEEKEMSDDLMKVIAGTAVLENYVPRYLNQAINFTGEDMGGDRAMITTLLYVIIVIMAFVFGVTTSNTIAREAAVIGTLRASGYKKGELVRHYMIMPALVTVIGAVIGNILGYTCLKDVCAGMYYGSYSLTTYKTVWNADAFIMTTVVPLVLMLLINFLVLVKKLSLSPLQFLRRELRKKSKKKAFPLNEKLPFLGRFRLRVIFQNMSSYALLFIGILFANLLLLFGLLLPAVLKDFQNSITDHMICEYQYLLKTPMETENDQAEKFAAVSLETLEGTYKSEDISIFGVEDDSAYLALDFSGGHVYVSDGYAEKFKVKPGDTVTLKERYGDRKYEFTVDGTYDYPGALSVFMSRETFCDTFDRDAYYFNGYFSNEKLTDLDEKYVATVIDEEALTKLSRQLDVSMGQMMYLVDGFAIMIYVVLLYLLSKIVIEKNAQSISMVKILGYTGGEISRLYLVSTAVVVVLSLLISLPIESAVMRWLFENYMMQSISGWLPYTVSPVIFVKMMVIGLVTYAAVAALEYRKIRKVPLDEALKNAE